MEKIKPSERNLLSDTVELCYNNKIKMVIVPQKTYRRCSGWVRPGEFLSCFDPKGEYSANWGVFVHESCHVDQMIDEDSIWYDDSFNVEKDWLDLHTRGKTRKSKKIERYFKKILELELDCEKRAVEKIKKYNLNIDVKKYIKTGNVYLFSHYGFYHLKCWYSGKKRIYDELDIVNTMPEKHLHPSEYWVKNDIVFDFLKNNGSRKN